MADIFHIGASAGQASQKSCKGLGRNGLELSARDLSGNLIPPASQKGFERIHLIW
jgi:hypothetical protein